jgi:hypothetical protein
MTVCSSICSMFKNQSSTIVAGIEASGLPLKKNPGVPGGGMTGSEGTDEELSIGNIADPFGRAVDAGQRVRRLAHRLVLNFGN